MQSHYPNEQTALKVSQSTDVLEVAVDANSNTNIASSSSSVTSFTRFECHGSQAKHRAAAIILTAGLALLLTIIVHSATTGGAKNSLPVDGRDNATGSSSSGQFAAATTPEAKGSLDIDQDLSRRTISRMQPFSTLDPAEANCPHMDRPDDTWPTEVWGGLANASTELHTSLPTNAWWENIVLGSPTQVRSI